MSGSHIGADGFCVVLETREALQALEAAESYGLKAHNRDRGGDERGWEFGSAARGALFNRRKHRRWLGRVLTHLPGRGQLCIGLD